MKKFLKSIALMLLAGALVLGFASCSNDSSDSSNSSSGVGVALSSLGTLDATYQKDDEGKWKKIYLFSNGKAARASQDALAGGVKDGITKTGTFVKTNTYKDGTITITWDKQLQKDGSWGAVDERDKTDTLTLTNGTSGSWTLTGNDSSSTNTNTNNNSTAATVSATYKLTENGKWWKIFLYNDDTCALAREEAVGIYKEGIIKKGKFTKSAGATWETGVFNIKWTQKYASMTEEKFTSDDGDSTLMVVQGTGTLTSGNEAPKVFTLQK